MDCRSKVQRQRNHAINDLRIIFPSPTISIIFWRWNRSSLEGPLFIHTKINWGSHRGIVICSTAATLFWFDDTPNVPWFISLISLEPSNTIYSRGASHNGSQPAVPGRFCCATCCLCCLCCLCCQCCTRRMDGGWRVQFKYRDLNDKDTLPAYVAMQVRWTPRGRPPAAGQLSYNISCVKKDTDRVLS